jgi:hypothetical protein
MLELDFLRAIDRSALIRTDPRQAATNPGHTLVFGTPRPSSSHGPEIWGTIITCGNSNGQAELAGSRDDGARYSNGEAFHPGFMAICAGQLRRVSF